MSIAFFSFLSSNTIFSSSIHLPILDFGTQKTPITFILKKFKALSNIFEKRFICYIRLSLFFNDYFCKGGSKGLDKRKCIGCGALLSEDDVMKIIMDDGSSEVFPLSTCPECFKKDLLKTAHQQKKD